ncbi:MAG: DeoR/GlpR family DNA-binding transcription regulator [Oscillospiraceae bacterium]|jgi:DeoR family myo-inositol catabolism operon transcriptional repressor|nr:DeoR/GlpR family DNA-binding transcription regulator [Oscillospiraceae bacterium]
MRTQRIEEIKNYIYERRTATLDEICDYFQVSKSTLRRDLDSILQSNDIKKIYGGVTALPKKELVPFQERNISHLESKRKIAAAAATLVQDNDIIFIDSGTTTLPIIDYIKDSRNITVLTNNVEIIFQAIPYDNINIISLAGTLNRKTLSFTGNSAAQTLQNYNISKAFMAATGFSIANGLTHSSPPESDIKRMAIERSQQIYLLADSSKCGHVSLITYCDLNRIDALITESELPKEYGIYFTKNGQQLIIANR